MRTILIIIACLYLAAILFALMVAPEIKKICNWNGLFDYIFGFISIWVIVPVFIFIQLFGKNDFEK